LNETEIKTFWNKLSTAKMEKYTTLALKLQLITAQRKGEVAGAEWVNFDLKDGWWTIPAEKSKNGFPHRVPLSPLAMETLNELEELTGSSRWLFPSPRDGQHIAETSVDHAVRENAEHFEVDHFTPHDLRRTAASMMTASGIQRMTVSKILNHVESSVTAVYDRHSYDNEKRGALSSWGLLLETILGRRKANKVIPIRNSKMT
jgi:integrase